MPIIIELENSPAAGLQVLYVQPSFCRKNEVHTRLAIMFKNKNDFEAANKHFHLVLLCRRDKVRGRGHEQG